MYFDSRMLTENTSINTDICIMGGGAAGITLALSLKKKGYHVCILEGGGIGFEASSQALYQGRNTGDDYDPLDICRLRQLGGATNHWGGWTRQLKQSDFSKREWLNAIGWPISFEDLQPFYLKAEELLQLGHHKYDLDYWEELSGKKRSLDQGDVESVVFRMSPPTRFGFEYGPDFQNDKDVDIYLYANINDIRLNKSKGAVTEVKCRTLSGNAFTVRAKRYVLACGGIENARVLLACNNQCEGGIGNHYDQVGRYFSDHAGMWAGALVLSNTKRDMSLYGMHQPFIRGGSQTPPRIIGALTLNKQLLLKKKLPNFCAFVVPNSQGGAPKGGEKDMLGLKHAVQRISTTAALASQYGIAIPGAEVASSTLYQVIINAESSPNPSSRVTIDAERDVLGMHKPSLHWKIARQDYDSHEAIAYTLACQLGAAGIGRMYVPDEFDESPHYKEYGRHHMGTTRMSLDPKEGVVDQNCKVHGVENLYVAGSSVFPSYGYAQPTLTIVAMSLRLGKHLLNVMGKA